jgi:hypothetical protein
MLTDYPLVVLGCVGDLPSERVGKRSIGAETEGEGRRERLGERERERG